MRWEPGRKSCGLDYESLENSNRHPVGRSNQPALRFRYTEENVTREPARTTTYANGTASPHQSISNMTVSCLLSLLSFDRYGGGYSKLSSMKIAEKWWSSQSEWSRWYNYLQVMIVSGVQERKKGVKYLFKVTVARVAAPLSLCAFPAPPESGSGPGWRNTTTN